MQKRAFIAIIAALVAATAAACALILFFKARGGLSADRQGASGWGSADTAQAASPLSRVVVARASGGDEGDASGGDEQGGAASGIRPAFPLEANEHALQVFNADINIDGTYDQVCAVRRGGESEIYIICAIQNPVTTAYTRLEPIRTGVTQLRTLLVSFADVTGRQGNALVYSGMNSNSLQVLGIFSVEEDEARPSGFYLKEMLKITADGVIQVEEVRRSEAYSRGMAAGASYPVVSYHSAPSSASGESTPAQIRRTYTWNPLSGVYELSAETRVSAETAGAMVVQSLREGGNDALFRFFKGVWYKTDGGARGMQIGFDLAEDEIIFVDGQTQEVFESESVSARRYGVYLVAHNSLINSIRRSIDIEIAGPDEIQVRASDDVRLRIAIDSSWDGAYRRMRNASSAPAASGARRIAATLEAEPAGWTDSSGAVYVFKDGSLVIQNLQAGRRNELKYAIYMVREAAVMQVKDGAGKPAFYILRERDDGLIAMQEATVLGNELKETASPEIELKAVAQETEESGGQ